jgi:hypothetical protein
LSNGGNAVCWNYGWPSQCFGDVGGDGGNITLTSASDVQLHGTMSTAGGDTLNTYPNNNPSGNGGRIVIGYQTIADSSDSSLIAAGGERDPNGKWGDILGDYTGPNDPAQNAMVAEQEPNNTVDDTVVEAQPLFAPVEVDASISADDAGDLVLTYGDDVDDFEDLYRLGLRNDMVVNIHISQSPETVDFDLIVLTFDQNTGTYDLVVNQATTALSESISKLPLAAGTYFVGVSQFGDTPVGTKEYKLTIQPTAP